ncbi:hypothetical protein L917_14351 [Phytophthora nicotianae]|uniref:Uncharacterized protein n=1 Tax=Phytophthora nicotianae TaxID=4792 RepID=W2KPD4_PHYNI|nr:hypothetical protein L915_14628 [Phytophthora nicotianae]ETL32947.1 hypothetical protein L916_14536 [Phytophthora nicotianae]ETL86205.1 hypothetical protein L917_14351 [Phytophthora nicotianae]
MAIRTRAGYRPTVKELKEVLLQSRSKLPYLNSKKNVNPRRCPAQKIDQVRSTAVVTALEALEVY